MMKCLPELRPFWVYDHDFEKRLALSFLCPFCDAHGKKHRIYLALEEGWEKNAVLYSPRGKSWASMTIYIKTPERLTPKNAWVFDSIENGVVRVDRCSAYSFTPK